MKEWEASITIEAAIIMSMAMLLFFVIMKLGLQLYDETRTLAGGIIKDQTVNAVKLFYELERVRVILSIQFSYYRNIHASHMILTPALEGEPWEKEMLWRNRPRELILPEYNSRNGQTQLWYDITGKQAVDMLAELSDISYEIFIKICEAVVAMAEVLDGLLISPDILLLRPESIFFDNQTENVSFCCYFGNEKEIGKSFHELLEYLLAKLDHKNVNGVQTAYELFEYTRMDGYCIAEIKKILRKAEYTEDVPEKITETVWKEEESEYMSIPVENKKKGILRLWQQKEQNIFGRIRKLLQGGKIPEKKVEPFVFEPEPEINMHQQNPTVLLADLPKKEYGILKYEGNGTCSELSIDHTPYIIGSELDCDGVIPSGTVSRHHARITRKGEVYFIEDLNSSNGTMVGGELLNCRVKMSLQAQETVMFADEKFRFI